MKEPWVEMAKNALPASADAPKRRRVSITCFQPDPVKEGGSYIRISGVIRDINFTDRNLILSDGRVIPLRFVVAIHGSFV